MDDVVMYRPNSYDRAFIAKSDGIFEGDWVARHFLPFEYQTALEVQQKLFEYMELQGSSTPIRVCLRVDLAGRTRIRPDQAARSHDARNPC